MPVIRSPTRHRYLCELPYSIEEDRQRPTVRKRRSKAACCTGLPPQPAKSTEPAAEALCDASPATIRSSKADTLHLDCLWPDSRHELLLKPFVLKASIERK